jgi:hypothetical protein
LNRSLLSCKTYIFKTYESVPRRKCTKGNRIPFADSLKSEEDKKIFIEILEKCEKYSLAINAKGKPFPTEPLIMALLLEQHKMINWLQNKISLPKQRFFKSS